jgi:hypothetical protein
VSAIELDRILYTACQFMGFDVASPRERSHCKTGPARASQGDISGRKGNDYLALGRWSQLSSSFQFSLPS